MKISRAETGILIEPETLDEKQKLNILCNRANCVCHPFKLELQFTRDGQVLSWFVP